MSDVPNGSAPPAGNPPADGGQAPAPDAKWYSGLQDADLRGFAELKGWDTPDKAINSYRNLEKFQGLPPERLAKIPDKDDAAGWTDFNKRFGWAAPEDAAEYKFDVPEGQSTAYADSMRQKFKELGVPVDLGNKLVAEHNAALDAILKAEDAAFNVKAESEMAQLRAEWGGEFEKLNGLAQRAKEEFAGSFDKATLDIIEDVIGPAAHAKLWAAIGSKLGEAKFVDGKTDSLGPMTPDAARARLQQLHSDKAWFQRLESGDIRARQEWESLKGIVNNATIR